MKNLHICYLTGLCAMLVAATAVACDSTGLSKTPRATFSKIACLDVNGDDRINEQDAQDPGELPDFNADDERDQQDAEFLLGVDIALAPNTEACSEDAPDEPEYAVAHGYFSPAEVSCDQGDEPVLLVGVGGGVVNLKDKASAAGIREVISDLQDRYDDEGVDTLSVLAGPAMAGAQNVHTGMEDWTTNVVRVYLERYPCLRAAIVGHSHGAVTADVVAARLEDQYADRFVVVVDLDRVDELYTGDTASRPDVVPVFNVHESNDPTLSGEPYESPNVENWDASDEQGPESGDKGGDLKPVNHTTIDNSESVRDRIVDEVLERS
ncbi:MAG: hypothetical protein WEB52_12330 [Dehalococcoidia bacterium]